MLDHQAPRAILERVNAAIEGIDGNRIADLHVWSIGPGIFSATITVVSNDPGPPEYYKNLIPEDLGIVHSTVEVHRDPQVTMPGE